ncbi:MAG: sensor histidine kinase [Thermaceae bacterium]
MNLITRLFLAFGLLWALLLLVSLATARKAVGQSLRAHLEATLLQDAQRVAEAYTKGQVGRPLATGGVQLHLYTPDGTPLVLTEPAHRLDADQVRTASSTPRVLFLEGFAAALVQTPLGTLVLTQETGYIGEALASLDRGLLWAFALLLPLGLFLVYVTARLIAKPILRTAQEISRRGPEDLTPLPPGGKDEVGVMVESVNRLLQALKEAKEREKAFLAEVSHELRTPLTVLLGHLERLPKSPESLEALRKTALHLSRLVEDLLALAKGEAERSLNLHVVDLLAVLEDVAQEQGVGVRGETVEVLGDPDRLLQLFRNITQNAVRAAGREGVEIRLRKEGNWAQVEVEDKGPGIPEELLPRLFERFAKGQGGGSGLGLAIAQQIAQAHGGRIEVDSIPGRTVFRVLLPLLEEEVE